MRLYLSSYKFGEKTDDLIKLVGTNTRVAVIANAIDFRNGIERSERVERELQEFRDLGFIPEEIDLRNYFGKTDSLSEKLKEFGLIWARGGNVFILQRAMTESGFTIILKRILENDAAVYGGYSAGILVLTPTLHGLELVDDSDLVPAGYKKDFTWNGLGIVNYSIAPHYKSEHPESVLVDKVVEYFEKNNMPYRTLRDGDVIITHE